MNLFPKKISSLRIAMVILIITAFFQTGCNHATSAGSGIKPLKFKPNILWITCEDMSPHLGCFGDDLARTPVLDQLAAEGVRYTNVFSVSGVCAPSRAAIITGLYPTSFGAQHMRTMTRTASIDKVTDPVALAIPVYEAVPPPEVRCFSEFLRADGYYCTNNNKQDYQFRAPVTAWDESSNTAHWKNRKPGQPFFAVFNIGITHESQIWARADDTLITDPDKVSAPPYYPDSPVVRRDLARMYDNIALMDAEVGRLLKELDQAGLTDSTIIFFYSDHGDGTPRAKRWVYDSGLLVPMIIRFPGATKAGETVDELISFIDFAPTVLSITGIDIPDYMQGRAFLGKQKSGPPEFIFAARDRMDPAVDNMRAVRNKKFKYIKNYMPDRPYVQFLPYRDQMALMQELFRFDEEGKLDDVQQLWFSKTKPDEELYDLESDPFEINNLAQNPGYEEVLEKMREAHTGWKEKYDPYCLVPEDELVKMLWPPDGIQPETAQVQFDYKNKILKLGCETEGASIGYKMGWEGPGQWNIYTGPVKLEGSGIMAIVAHRIGYKPGEIITFQWN